MSMDVLEAVHRLTTGANSGATLQAAWPDVYRLIQALDADRTELGRVRDQRNALQALEGGWSARQVSDYLAQVTRDRQALERERDEAREALRKVRAIIWNWGGPANRNEAGEWVVMKQFETAMVDAIAAVLGAPEEQEDT